MSDCAITLFVALLKRAIAKSLCLKERMSKKVLISQSHFFLSLKRAIAHFQKVGLPNPENPFFWSTVWPAKIKTIC